MSVAKEDKKDTVIVGLTALRHYEEKKNNDLLVRLSFSQKLRHAILKLNSSHATDQECLKRSALAEYFLYKESRIYKILSIFFSSDYANLIDDLDKLEEVKQLKEEFDKDRKRFIQHQSDVTMNDDTQEEAGIRKNDSKISNKQSNAGFTPISQYDSGLIQSVDEINPIIQLKEFHQARKHERMMYWLFPSALIQALDNLEIDNVDDPEKINHAYKEYFNNDIFLYLLSFFYPDMKNILQKIDQSYVAKQYKLVITSQSSTHSTHSTNGSLDESTSINSAFQEITDRMSLQYRLQNISNDSNTQNVEKLPYHLVQFLLQKLDWIGVEHPDLLNRDSSLMFLKQKERFKKMLNHVITSQDSNLAAIFFRLLEKDELGRLMLASDVYIDLLFQLPKEQTRNIAFLARDWTNEQSSASITDGSAIDLTQLSPLKLSRIIDHLTSSAKELVIKPQSDEIQSQIQIYLDSNVKNEEIMYRFRLTHSHAAVLSETQENTRARPPELIVLDELNQSLLKQIKADSKLNALYEYLLIKGYIVLPLNPMQLEKLLTLPKDKLAVPNNQKLLADVLSHVMIKDDALKKYLQAIEVKVKAESQPVVISLAEGAVRNLHEAQNVFGDAMMVVGGTLAGATRRVSGIFNLNGEANHLVHETTEKYPSSESLSPKEPEKSDQFSSYLGFSIPFSFSISEEQITHLLKSTKMMQFSRKENLSALQQKFAKLDPNKKLIVYEILSACPHLINDSIFERLMEFEPVSGMAYNEVLARFKHKGLLKEQYIRDLLNSQDKFYSQMVQKIELDEGLLRRLPAITKVVHALSPQLRQDVEQIIYHLHLKQALSLKTLQALRLQLVVSRTDLGQNTKNLLLMFNNIHPSVKLTEDMALEWLTLSSEKLNFYGKVLPKILFNREAMIYLKQIYQMYGDMPEILSIISERLPDIVPLALNPDVYWKLKQNPTNIKALLTNHHLVKQAKNLLDMGIDLVRYQEQLLKYPDLEKLVSAMAALQKLDIHVSNCFDVIISAENIDAFIAKVEILKNKLGTKKFNMSKLDSKQLQKLLLMGLDDLQAFSETIPYFERMKEHPLEFLSLDDNLRWVNILLIFKIIDKTKLPDTLWPDIFGDSDLDSQSTEVLQNILSQVSNAPEDKIKALNQHIEFLLPNISRHLLEKTEAIKHYVLKINGYLESQKAVAETLEKLDISHDIQHKILQSGSDSPDKWVDLHHILIFLEKFELVKVKEKLTEDKAITVDMSQLDKVIGHLLNLPLEPFYKAKNQITQDDEVKRLLVKLIEDADSGLIKDSFCVLLGFLSNTGEEDKQELIAAMGSLLSCTKEQREKIKISLNVLQHPCNRSLLTVCHFIAVIQAATKNGLLFSDINIPALMNGERELTEVDFQRIISIDPSNRTLLLDDIEKKYSPISLPAAYLNGATKVVETGVAAVYGAAKAMCHFGFLSGQKSGQEQTPAADKRPNKS